MCLAIPARVVSVNDNRMAQIDIHGVTRTASLDLVPDAEIGSWVLVHAGFAIQVVDEQFAGESWDLIKQMADADALDPDTAALAAAATQARAASADGAA